jgi:very-short-patch-repair endonuclease
MENKKLHSLPIHKEKRTNLRNNLTPAEAKLWSALKNGQLHGRKFIRQHSIENYIVDFYCAAEKLIVELDGQVHFNPGAAENDLIRTERLNQLDFTVVRFENKLVFEDMDGVLREIVRHFRK